MLTDLLAPAVKTHRGQYGVGSWSDVGDLLSAGEEPAGLGHLVTVLPLSTEAEGDRSDTNHKGAHDCGVDPPVGRLGIPTTSGGPNFLGVPVG